jgi:hypothetical protein
VARASVLALTILLCACSGGDTPSEPEGCIRLDGTYALSYSEGSCGRSGGGAERTVVVNQNGCQIQAVLPGYALLDGTITGSTVLFSLTLLEGTQGACGNAHLSGTGTVTATAGGYRISGTYGTSSAPPSGCACVAAPGQGTLVLTE